MVAATDAQGAPLVVGLAVGRYRSGRTTSVAFRAGVLEVGRRPVALVEDEIAVPRSGWEIRASGLWADHVCEQPVVHWSYGLEAFALRLDEPADLLGVARGERCPLGWELEFETGRSPEAAGEGYRLVGRAHGIVLVGDREIELDGRAVRIHRWGRTVSRSVGELDDGRPARAAVALPGARWHLVADGHRSRRPVERRRRWPAGARSVMNRPDPVAPAGMSRREWGHAATGRRGAEIHRDGPSDRVGHGGDGRRRPPAPVPDPPSTVDLGRHGAPGRDRHRSDADQAGPTSTPAPLCRAPTGTPARTRALPSAEPAWSFDDQTCTEVWDAFVDAPGPRRLRPGHRPPMGRRADQRRLRRAAPPAVAAARSFPARSSSARGARCSTGGPPTPEVGAFGSRSSDRPGDGDGCSTPARPEATSTVPT